MKIQKLMSCCQLSQKSSFISMMLLTSSFFLVEIIVGYVTNSMALVADSFHMLSDVASLIVGFLALRYSRMGQQKGRYTFGWVRAEVLGALVNAVFLVALCFSILVEALKRLVIPEGLENARLVLIVGAVGLVVNIIGLFLFAQHGHSHGGHGHSHGGGHGHSHGGTVSKSTTNGNHSHSGHGHSHGKKGNKEKDSLSTKSMPDSLIANTSIAPSEKTISDQRSEASGAEQPLLNDVSKVHEVESINNGSAIVSMDAVTLSEDMQPYTDTVQPNAKDTSPTQLNIRGVYLHVLGDALGSVIVMISALIVMFVDAKWTHYVDPAMSIVMVLIILKTSIPLLKETSMILMQTVPTHIKIQEIQTKLVEEIPGIISVHEFHIWQLAGNKIIASAHVRCRTLADYMAIANQLKEFFHNEGIHSTTIQPEFLEQTIAEGEMQEDNGSSCLVECGPDKNCAESMCCPGDTLSKKGSDGTASKLSNGTSSKHSSLNDDEQPLAP